jgi:hypothetical protein
MRISCSLTPVAGQKFEDQLAKLCRTNGDVRRLGPGEGGRRGCLKTFNGSRRIENEGGGEGAGGSKTKIFGEGVAEYGMRGEGTGSMTKTK